MAPVKPGESCPSCGQTAGSYVPSPHHLPPGTVLLDRYLVGRALWKGYFCINYIGRDLRQDRVVAIKEYYPHRLARRPGSTTCFASEDTLGERAPFAVWPVEGVNEGYWKGMITLLEAAERRRRLGKFPGIVQVLDVFSAKSTAYVVLEHVEGNTLLDYVSRQGPVKLDELLRGIWPMMEGLERLHAAGAIHRDIRPHNILRRPGGALVLLDDLSPALKDIFAWYELSPGLSYFDPFFPLKQDDTQWQGPHTNVYALRTILYYCLTGQTPPDASERSRAELDGQNDPLIPPSRLGAVISPYQEYVLLKGLALWRQQRYQTMRDLQADLLGPFP